MTTGMLRQLDDEGIEFYLAHYREGLELNGRRLERLRQRQARDPFWKYFDRFVEEEIGIDIIIECHEAVRGETEEYIKRLEGEQWRRRGLNQTMRMF